MSIQLLQIQLQRAAALLRQGDLAAAREAGEAALRTAPDHPATLQFLGVVACQAGDISAGADFLRRSLKREPKSPTTRLNLAKALAALGQNAEAEKVCSEGAERPDLLRILGDLRKARGDSAGAIEAYRRALAVNPDFPEAWNNLGDALRMEGDPEAALSAFERACTLDQRLVAPLLNKARMLAALGAQSAAIAAYEAALALTPNDANARLELSTQLHRAGKYNAAAAALEKALAGGANDPAFLVEVALVHAAASRPKEAEAAYRAALELAPSNVAAHLNLGILLEQNGRIDELEQALAAADAAGVRHAQLGILYAALARRRGDVSTALAEAAAAEGDGVVALMRAQLIGDLQDRQGNTDAAFAAFSEMNARAARAPAAKGGPSYIARLDRLISLVDGDWLSTWSKVEIDTKRRAPVFLVGFPRSGTTLLDTMLWRHPALSVLEEQPLVWRLEESAGDISALATMNAADVARLREQYFTDLDSLAPPAPDAVIIDKLPLHIARLAIIHRVFPDARFIFALRHPCDAVLSCFMQNFPLNQAMANLLDLPSAARLYDRIMTYWTLCSEKMRIQSHVVRYESLVADAEAEMRALVAFLGLPWHEGVLDNRGAAAARGPIHTPSYAQVAEPIYTRAAGRWTRYRGHMEEILPILAPWAERFGYGAL